MNRARNLAESLFRRVENISRLLSIPEEIIDFRMPSTFVFCTGYMFVGAISIMKIRNGHVCLSLVRVQVFPDSDLYLCAIVHIHFHYDLLHNRDTG